MLTAGDAPGAGSRHLLVAMPFIFVMLWSTGFIAAKFGLPYAPPLTFLVLRFFGVALLLMPLVALTQAPWPHGRVIDIAVAGVLLHAGYVGGVWCAIKLGMPAGLAALIAGMQPVLTALAAPIIGEKVRPRQWIGLMLGLCGVALVVLNKITAVSLSYESIGLGILGLLGITIGTLYQKKRCAYFDLRSGTLIQYLASAVIMLVLAIVFEDFDGSLATVQWTPRFIGALIWSIFVLSIGAVFLLFALIRKSAATRVTSLLYLTPPTTAIMAWIMFGEAFTVVSTAGMAIAVLGVAFVVKK